MPRSKLSNWSSRQRLAYCEDHLITHGYINREALQAYFGLERSTGSMDLAAYRAHGGKLRRASAGETVGGEVVRGHKLGGKAMYVAADDWEPVAGTSEARREAWALLTQGQLSHREWLARIYKAWRADHPSASVADLAEYFGISVGEASRVKAGGHGSRVRAGVWELLK